MNSTSDEEQKAEDDRPLPQDLDAERAVLGAILLDNRALNIAVERLKRQDFLLNQHRRIFQHMIALGQAQQGIDLITLTDQLHRSGELEATGGAAYLAQLVDGVPHVTNVEHYARIVKEKALLRSLIHQAHAIQQQAFSAEQNAVGIIDRAAALLASLSAEAVREGSMKFRAWADIPKFAELPDEPISWLVEELIPRSAVVLFAGEPDSYKTFLALCAVKGVATGGTFLGQACTAADALYLDRENPLGLVSERREILELSALENARVWGSWEKDPPPGIGDMRLLEIAKERKPLMVFDSFLRFHTADENSATEMARVMADLRALANAGASPWLQHHRPKSEVSKYRDSSDILAGVDVAISVSRDRQRGIIRLECFKNRFGKEFSLSVRPDLEESGEFIVVEAPAATQERQDVERLQEFISANSGKKQHEVVAGCGLPKGRARALLLRHEGREWRVEPGEHNAKPYYPLGRQAQAVEITI